MAEQEYGKTEISGLDDVQPSLSFNDSTNEAILVFEPNGDIFWRGRLVITDKELVDGLRDVIITCLCPQCKNQRYNSEVK